MGDPRRLILLLFVATAMAACGPTIETRYSYTPPAGPAGQACIQQCEQSRAYCAANAQVSLQTCKADALRRAEIDYRAYLHGLRRGEKPDRSISYYDTSYSCTSEEGRCKLGFHDCYAACGGQVITRRFCTADCDQLKPPVPPFAQVGPTLVNGVAQRPVPAPTVRPGNAAMAPRPGVQAPAAVAVAPLAQRYRVSGTDYDGSGYEGTVTVRADGGGYRIRWTIGSETYNGVGTLSGDRLAIESSDAADPFRYDLRVFPDGSLMGRWTSGDEERGSEEWRPG